MKLDHVPERLFRREEAAEYLQGRGVPITRQALAKMAVVGGGPLFRKIGKWPLYGPDDLDSWIAEKLSAPVRSTAELPRRKSAA
jgi:hypothetical protein